MRPAIPERGEDEMSNQAEIAIEAAKLALADANKTAADVDAVIVSCAYTQRAYPAIAIEVQEALGIEGWPARPAPKLLLYNMDLAGAICAKTSQYNIKTTSNSTRRMSEVGA